MNWTVLLKVWSAGSLRVESLGQLERTLQLHILWVLSTMSSRAEWCILLVAVAWTGMAAGLPLGLKLTLLLHELSAFVL
jgi:predicted small integral membrane protein